MHIFGQAISLVLKVSRPRFWLYLAGPYLVGFAFASAGLTQFTNPIFWLFLIYFLVPANIFLYGVNDLYDTDTDALNQKKETHETRVQASNQVLVKRTVLVSLAISMGMFWFLRGYEFLIFALFIFLSAFYSMKPIRFKAIPFLDFSSNILYVLPAWLAYYQVSGLWPAQPVLFASFLWAMAMHLFSAVPDIKPDQEAGIKTSAVFLGKEKSLLLTSLFWLVAWILVFKSNYLGGWIYLFLVYPLLPLAPFIFHRLDIARLYWLYPYINSALGFVLFLLAVQDLF